MFSIVFVFFPLFWCCCCFVVIGRYIFTFQKWHMHTRVCQWYSLIKCEQIVVSVVFSPSVFTVPICFRLSKFSIVPSHLFAFYANISFCSACIGYLFHFILYLFVLLSWSSSSLMSSSSAWAHVELDVYHFCFLQLKF